MLFPEVKVVESYWDYIKTANMPVAGWLALRAVKFPCGGANHNKIFYHRGESLLEHQAKTAVLLRLFMENFPEMFKDMSDSEKLDLMTFSLIKNVAEINTGNMIKDGRYHPIVEKQKRFSTFAGFVKLGFGPRAEKFVSLYDRYKDSSDRVAKIISYINLLEHVLTLAYHRSLGFRTNVARKKVRTALVRRLIRFTHSREALDIFAADLAHQVKCCADDIKNPILLVLDQASLKARGGPFYWIRRMK